MAGGGVLDLDLAVDDQAARHGGASGLSADEVRRVRHVAGKGPGPGALGAVNRLIAHVSKTVSPGDRRERPIRADDVEDSVRGLGVMASEAPNAVAPTAAVQAVIRVAVSAIGQPSQLCWIETVSFIAHPFSCCAGQTVRRISLSSWCFGGSSGTESLLVVTTGHAWPHFRTLCSRNAEAKASADARLRPFNGIGRESG